MSENIPSADASPAPENVVRESKDQRIDLRLHIGNISASLAESIHDLEQRLSKYGILKTHLQLHRKPLVDTFFAYLDINIVKSDWTKLRGAFHNVMYKGSRLTIDKARPSYEQLWTSKYSRDNNRVSVLNKSQAKRKYGGASGYTVDVYPGRMRVAKRKNIKNATFRVIINDKVHVLHCKKKKLWGVVKNKPLSSLTWSYIEGQWRDGNGDTVETVDYEKLLKTLERSSSAGQPAGDDNNVAVEDEIVNERAVNLKVLESLFQGGDSVQVEEFGRIDPDEFKDEEYGYEEDMRNRESESESESKSESEEESEDESEEDSQSEAIDDPIEDVSMAESITQDSRDSSKMDITSTSPEPPANTTSVLRSVFSEPEGQFKLFGGDDSDSDSVPNAEPEAKHTEASSALANHTPVPEPFTAIKGKSFKVGLFFPHFDSHFLSAQSQVSKLASLKPSVSDETAVVSEENDKSTEKSTGKSSEQPSEQSSGKSTNQGIREVHEEFSVEKFKDRFWEKRGEIHRELKRKRRDVLRQFKRKSQAKNKAIL